VLARGDGDLELRADAVGRRNQDRVLESRRLQVEERAEAAEPGARAPPRRRARERLDRFDQRIPGVDIDAGGTVGVGLYGVLARVGL
jgi:hypothetical protein